MSRFEARHVDKGEYGGWYEVRDTLRDREVFVTQDWELAGAVAGELNKLKPVCYATTYEGNVFIDVRCGPYAGALAVNVKEAEDSRTGLHWCVGQALQRLEMQLYSTLASYAARR